MQDQNVETLLRLALWFEYAAMEISAGKLTSIDGLNPQTWAQTANTLRRIVRQEENYTPGLDYTPRLDMSLALEVKAEQDGPPEIRRAIEV